MASRTKEKEAARQRRLEQEAAAKAATQRKQRLTIAGSLLVVVIAVAVVLVIVLGGSSSSDNSANATNVNSKQAKTAAATVESLLKGIPQHGTTLGNPKAKVTFTEYGDLECPICKEFSEGAEIQLIKNEVKSGKVKLVYKSFETATANGPDADMWSTQQSAAYAAGA
jgi:protein-disulfide isomerase